MLKVRLLGVPRLHVVSRLTARSFDRTSSLLGSLLFYFAGKSFRRDYLADLLWPDAHEVQARAALNTALWRIRSMIGIRVPIIANHTEVCLELVDSVAVDARDYDKAAHGVLATARDIEVDRLQRVADMYFGPLLEGEEADWVSVERERLLELHLGVLGLLAHKLTCLNRLGAAVEVANQILQLDPYQESIHRDLMVLFTLQGRRNLALKQFEHLRELLSQELGLAVSRDVLALVETVKSSHGVDSLEQMRTRCFDPGLC